jgi:predicted transcriptional regulator
MLGQLLRRDREQLGLRIGQAAWLLGVTPAEYQRLERSERWPSWETYDRIERLFGWPRTFVGDSLGYVHGAREDPVRALLP